MRTTTGGYKAINSNASLTITEDTHIGYFYLQIAKGTTVDTVLTPLLLIDGQDESYIEHQEQKYTGTEVNIKTYADVTNIYNVNSIDMKAKIRVKGEE